MVTLARPRYAARTDGHVWKLGVAVHKTEARDQTDKDGPNLRESQAGADAVPWSYWVVTTRPTAPEARSERPARRYPIVVSVPACRC